MQRRPGTAEERLACTRHGGAEVKPVRVDQAEPRQLSRQFRPGDAKFAALLVLLPLFEPNFPMPVPLPQMAQASRASSASNTPTLGARFELQGRVAEGFQIMWRLKNAFRY
jgi:hypothetical protein